MPIAIAIKIKTGKTSKKPIMEDLCNVVAKPTRKAIARPTPVSYTHLTLPTSDLV